jgi:hypothetical protein
MSDNQGWVKNVRALDERHLPDWKVRARLSSMESEPHHPSATVQLARYRRVNGVWLGSFASRVVLGTATAASLSCSVALAAAIWAAYGNRWWLVALWSAVGGAAYALSGGRWMDRYRRDPAAHARGESLVFLTLVMAAAISGLAMLVLNA